jgi:hypothetical protein
MAEVAALLNLDLPVTSPIYLHDFTASLLASTAGGLSMLKKDDLFAHPAVKADIPSNNKPMMIFCICSFPFRPLNGKAFQV